MAPSIRLRSTGLLVFGSRLVSVATGLVFLVMVARWLNPSQFGLWEFIVDLVTFASYPVALISFWVTRDVARGKLVGRTAIFLAMVMSGAGVALYSALGLLSYSRVTSSFFPFLLAVLLVPSSYWNQISNSIVSGYRPRAAGYSLLASEAAKLITAYPLLYIYRAGISGVILSLMVAYLTQAAVSTFATRNASASDLRISEAKRWFQTAWLPGMSTLPYFVGIADTFLASLAFGTTITGYYQAAFSIASIVGYSFYLSSALYPLLLAGGRQDLPAVTMDFSMLFGIPMAVGASILAPSILFLLAPKYVVGSLGLVILSFSSLLTTISYVLDQTLLGRDSIDVQERRSFWEYLHSDLFFVAAANLSYALGYNVLLLASLSFANSAGLSTAYAVAVWASAQLVTTIGVVIAKGLRTVRRLRFFPLGAMGRYTIASVAMGLLLYWLSGYALSAEIAAVEYGVRLAAIVLVGAAVYFGLLFIGDRKFRRLVLSFLNIFY